MYKYYLDIDGVIGDFCGHVIDYYNLSDEPFTEWNDNRIKDNWHKIEKDGYFWLSMPPIKQVINFTIAGYITARPVPSCLTSFWLSKNGFPYAPVITVPPMGKKSVILTGIEGAVLIDDAPHNYADCIENGIMCRLYNTPYNQDHPISHESDRIYSLADIVG